MMRSKGLQIIIFVLILTAFTGCAGTHGSFVNYCFPVNHEVLKTAIEKVMQSNPYLRKDTSEHDGYNDWIDYFVILVDRKEGTYHYYLRFYGDSLMWRTDSLNSCMFAWGMYDPQMKGGWEKDFGIFNHGLKKQLLQILDEELITKIDMELNVKHSEED